MYFIYDNLIFNNNSNILQALINKQLKLAFYRFVYNKSNIKIANTAHHWSILEKHISNCTKKQFLLSFNCKINLLNRQILLVFNQKVLKITNEQIFLNILKKLMELILSQHLNPEKTLKANNSRIEKNIMLLIFVLFAIPIEDLLIF